MLFLLSTIIRFFLIKWFMQLRPLMIYSVSFLNVISYCHSYTCYDNPILPSLTIIPGRDLRFLSNTTIETRKDLRPLSNTITESRRDPNPLSNATIESRRSLRPYPKRSQNQEGVSTPYPMRPWNQEEASAPYSRIRFYVLIHSYCNRFKIYTFDFIVWTINYYLVFVTRTCKFPLIVLHFSWLLLLTFRLITCVLN